MKDKHQCNEERSLTQKQIELLEPKSTQYEVTDSLDEINSKLNCKRKDKCIWRHNNKTIQSETENVKKLKKEKDSVVDTAGQYQAD